MAKKEATKRTWRWVTRDRDYWEDVINIHNCEEAPEEHYDPHCGATFGSGCASIAVADFKALFGFTPTKGRCVKIQFSAEAVN